MRAQLDNNIGKIGGATLKSDVGGSIGKEVAGNEGMFIGMAMAVR